MFYNIYIIQYLGAGDYFEHSLLQGNRKYSFYFNLLLVPKLLWWSNFRWKLWGQTYFYSPEVTKDFAKNIFRYSKIAYNRKHPVVIGHTVNNYRFIYFFKCIKISINFLVFRFLRLKCVGFGKISNTILGLSSTITQYRITTKHKCKKQSLEVLFIYFC